MDLLMVIPIVLGISAAFIIIFAHRLVSSMKQEKRQIIRKNLEDQMKIKARNMEKSDV